KKATLALICVALTCFGGTYKSKISSDLAQADSATTAQVIVQWNIATGASTTQKIPSLDGSVISEFKSIDAGVYALPVTAVSMLDAGPTVFYLSLDRALHHKLDYTAAAINATYAWNQNVDGTG